ncbi:SDR family oxidoreductase [Bradyrhizobium sp. INPA01-394B]|uniref:SDR family oxidoreductase n=1 Tax=Bradyrhizobium campsiandrae TaxID=1729892 RepID=A0ABR7U3K4_9BRAD|nr:SDR family oxidoreductase [Bradyrhizobium campsiandrae]MBC9879880.1 SDR family oxidoreductase [Bradyrhizobium campsiandrae]MBC9978565.1 SDR family oxidoreductase [Bradyrhizobium campsiandrae]
MLSAIPSFRIDGRRALVTGAGRGIGLAAAWALAEAGAHVTLCSRTPSEIGIAAKAIRDEGACADVLVLDVTDLEAVSAAIHESEPYDILVNNAGTNRPNHMTAVSAVDFDYVMNLNVRASFFVAQAVARRLIAAGSPGSIINISSQMGHVGAENRSLYCASKWAMEGFSKAMALDLARYRIRVNTIAPTFIETPMTKPFFDDQAFKDQVMSKIKLGRLGRVEDVVGAVVYLASEASSLMTGTSMLIDGGWTAE